MTMMDTAYRRSAGPVLVLTACALLAAGQHPGQIARSETNETVARASEKFRQDKASRSGDRVQEPNATITKHRTGKPIRSDSSGSVTQGTLLAYSIYDCFWSDDIDRDGDGYVRKSILKVDVDADDGLTHSVYLKVYRKPSTSSTYTLYFTTANYEITGDAFDPISSTVGSPNPELAYRLYDFKVEVYETGSTGIKASRNPASDPDLNNIAFETSAEDGLYSIADRRWTNIVDQNYDGYAGSAVLQTDVDVDDGSTRSIHLKIYSRAYGRLSYSLYLTTPEYQVTGSQIDPIDVVIGAPNSELTEDVYDFKIEVLETGGTDVVASVNDETDPGLHYQAFQTSAQDAPPVVTVTHTLNLRSGWGMISSYVDPEVAALETMFSGAEQDLIIMKSGAGKTYIPSIPVNTIGSWVNTEGYQVKMANARSHDITGLMLPNEQTASVPAGWSIIGYTRNCQASVVSALSSVVDDVIIVKDQDGKTYIPSIPVNQIGNLNPGQGYQIKMANARTLTFPVCGSPAPGAQKGQIRDGRDSIALHYHVRPTDVNATVVFPKAAVANTLRAGQEVGAYNRQGILVGSGIYPGESFSLPVWGDDPTTPERDGLTTGECFDLRIWDPATEREERIVRIHWEEGRNVYEPNGISVVACLESAGSLGLSSEQVSVGNYPNPFNPSTTITISLPDSRRVRVEVYDVLGRLVGELLNENLAAGYHEIVFDPHSQSTGVYYCRMDAGSFSKVWKMMLIK